MDIVRQLPSEVSKIAVIFGQKTPGEDGGQEAVEENG
jgi:hypothetical protein